MQLLKNLAPSSKLVTDILDREPPILGAPVLFELIRSYSKNFPNEKKANIIDENFDPSSSSSWLLNPFDDIKSQNPTNYSGFYAKSKETANFARNSIKQSNPYVFLTPTDINKNAEGIEKEFTTIRDTSKIKDAIDDYWNRIISYDDFSNAERDANTNVDLDQNYYGYFPGFHLIYSYMIENTKMYQIFEKIVSMYQQGEDLTIPYRKGDTYTRAWIDNTHLLFFSNSPYAVCNDNSLLGSNFEAMRRNGYHRLFGLDLNHGIGENNTTSFGYKRANHFNADFVNQFENFLKLCWQMMINYSNTSGINTTDLIALQEQANALKNILLARRTTEGNLNDYSYLNLSKLEFQSVVMAEWFNNALSYNSPIVIDMGAEGVSPSERLNKLGRRVGIAPHSKTGNFIDLAPYMATLLRLFELNEIDNDYIAAIANSTTRPYALISSILHNYQIATGKDLKNQVMVNNNYKNKLATV